MGTREYVDRKVHRWVEAGPLSLQPICVMCGLRGYPLHGESCMPESWRPDGHTFARERREQKGDTR